MAVKAVRVIYQNNEDIAQNDQLSFESQTLRGLYQQLPHQQLPPYIDNITIDRKQYTIGYPIKIGDPENFGTVAIKKGKLSLDKTIEIARYNDILTHVENIIARSSSGEIVHKINIGDLLDTAKITIA